MATARECLGPLASYFPYTSFTRVQEGVIPTLLCCDANVVVAAPTGSGKTALLEAAMLRLFKDRILSHMSQQEEAHTNCPDGRKNEGKAVYICPIKALASEKYLLWREKFPTLSVALETGDQELARGYDGGLFEMPNADIIITTPERWDSITRRWKEGVVWGLVASVALLLLDEVHTVNEERGAALEAVVSRMKAIKSSIRTRGPRSHTTRFVAISGTLPNIEDFAEWLQVEPQGVFSFTSADRPVPLTVRIVSYPSTSNNPFAFDRFLSFKLFGLIRQFSSGKPSIVFCASRGEAVNSALRILADIKETASRAGSEDCLRPTEEVEQLAASANDKQLRGLLLLGIAYHHAALSTSDRALVERMFREHYISVICTTTTLALGVNLPAHLVIIKGTTFFKGGRREDLPLSEIAQMSGRAGRPGFDSHGISLILTTEDKSALYEPLCHGDSSTTVESRLHQKMIEHVNAEVALRTIHSFSLGVEWIKTTFLWIRLRRCPRHYGILFATKEEELNFNREKFAFELMYRMLTELERQGCITITPDGFKNDEKLDKNVNHSGNNNNNKEEEAINAGGDYANCIVESTRIGRAMARRYVLLKTVELLNTEVQQFHPVERSEEKTAKPKEVTRTLEEVAGAASKLFTIPRLLCMLSRCAEFEDLYLRQGDRKHLNELNKIIRYPLKSGMRGGREVREDWHKVYVLIQAHLEHVQVSDFSLRNDLVRLWTSAPRLAHFLYDYALALNSYSFIKESSLFLCCIEQKMWWDGPIFKQLNGVGECAAKALMRGGIRTFADALSADPRKLETLCGRNPPFGNELQDSCRALPQYELCLGFSESSSEGMLQVVITEKPRETKAATKCGNSNRLVVIVGETVADTLLLYRQFTLDSGRDRKHVFTFQTPDDFCGHFVAYLFTEQHFLGSDVSATLVLDGNQIAEKSVATSKEGKPLKRKKEGENDSLLSSSGAFESLTRDLRWVEGISPRRSSEAGRFTLASLHSHETEKRGGEGQCIDVIGHESAIDKTSLTKSPSRDAGVVADCGSPDAATLTQSCSGVGGAGAQIDEDYKKLVEKTSNIAANLRFKRSSPDHPCKRPREEEEDSHTQSCGLLQGTTKPHMLRQETENLSFPRTRTSVVLPKAASPDPHAVPLSSTISQRPSARFQFNVQNAASQVVVMPGSFHQMEARQLFPPRELASSFGNRGYFAVGVGGGAACEPQRHVFGHKIYPNTSHHSHDFGGSEGGWIYGHPLQWSSRRVDGVAAGREKRLQQPPWPCVSAEGGGASSSAAAWLGQRWAPAAASPGLRWGSFQQVVREGRQTLDEGNCSLPAAGPHHNVQPVMPRPGCFYGMFDSGSGGAPPRATFIRKGWW